MTENSTRHREPGAELLLAERVLYRLMMAQGIGNSRICRELGISRRTGTRWRYGRREDRPGRHTLFYPPVATTPPQSISARFLSVQERLVIADLHRSGRTRRSIAGQLNRSPSTISREIRRNSDEDTGEYRPHAAQSKAPARRPRPSAGKLAGDPELRNFVQSCLEKRWSPEQISNVLPTEFPDQSAREMDVFPARLRRSLTWDQCGEMASHRGVTAATGMPVFFCDPRSPWQRGSNENTNGLLRQYFPKSSDLGQYSRADLDAVAAELNHRPRKVLDWQSPARKLAMLLATAN